LSSKKVGVFMPAVNGALEECSVYFCQNAFRGSVGVASLLIDSIGSNFDSSYESNLPMASPGRTFYAVILSLKFLVLTGRSEQANLCAAPALIFSFDVLG
jgi:hypothetical protein